MGAVDQEGIRFPAADDTARLLDHRQSFLCDLFQNLIPVGLAVALVDHMKMIDIHDDGIHGKILVVHVKLLRIPVEELPVVESRQLIPFRPADDIPVLGELDGAPHSGLDDLRLRIGLGNKIDGAQSQALHLRIFVGGHYNHGDPGQIRICLELMENIQAIHIAQNEIQKYQAQEVFVLIDDLQGLPARGGKENPIIVLFQNTAQHHTVDGFIFDHQNQPFSNRSMKIRRNVRHIVLNPF